MNAPIRRSRFSSFIIGIWVLISPAFSFVEAQDGGSSLDELRQEYYAKRQQVIDPLNEAYLAALDRLQKRLTEEGDVNAALRVLEWKTEVVARFSATKPGMEPTAVVDEAAEATAVKMAGQNEPGATSDESDSGKSEFNPVGTVWTWSAPGVHFVFENGGIGLGKFPQLETVDANFRWERKGPRKFMVTRPENPDFQVLFEVLADGDTAVYSSLGGSIFKRMVSRIPASE